MKLALPATHKQIAATACFLCALLTFFQAAICQDLSSPRFFTFNIQSLSTCSSPLAPQQTLAAAVPIDVASTYLYEFSLRFPLKLKGETKLLGEISHQNEFASGLYAFDDGNFNDIKPLELFQTSASLFLLHQFDERWKLVNILNIRTNSNRGFDFDRQAVRFSNAAMLEKKVKNGVLGFGLAVTAHQNVSVLPIVKYEAAINDKWGLDILFPSRVLATRNLSKSARLLFGARADAATYLLTNDDGIQDPFVGSNFRRININGIVGFEKQITPMVGFTAEVGATFPYKGGIFDYENSRIGLHDFQNRISPHFSLGFFLSLPRK